MKTSLGFIPRAALWMMGGSIFVMLSVCVVALVLSGLSFSNDPHKSYLLDFIAVSFVSVLIGVGILFRAHLKCTTDDTPPRHFMASMLHTTEE